MKKNIRYYHRQIGVIIAPFLILIATTGILLNHSNDFDLDQRHINWSWVLQHYGMGEVKAKAVFTIDSTHSVSQFDNQIFLNDKAVLESSTTIIGALSTSNAIVIATSSALTLISPDGQLIERMDSASGIPENIEQLGHDNNTPMINAKGGLWQGNLDLDKWTSSKQDAKTITWSQSGELPTDLEASILSHFHGKGVSLEHIILDLHNGRIIGKIGTWLVDLLGVLLVALCLSGLWLWRPRKN